jgi:hypothetical protein
VTESNVPILLMVVLGGALVGWLLRRFSPGMPFTKRMAYIVGGGILIGGVFYGAVMNR